MKRIVLVVLMMAASLAHAADIDAIVGKYSYDSYRLTLKNGKVLSLAGMGIASTVIEILPAMTELISMKMLDGTLVKSEAKILEVNVTGDQGYFVAQWPTMKAPVTQEFKLIDGGLTYTIRFTNPVDSLQFGSREEATLRRIGR